MMREVLKQMMPFFILMALLWLVAILLEKTMVTGTEAGAPVIQAPSVTP